MVGKVEENVFFFIELIVFLSQECVTNMGSGSHGHMIDKMFEAVFHSHLVILEAGEKMRMGKFGSREKPAFS